MDEPQVLEEAKGQGRNGLESGEVELTVPMCLLYTTIDLGRSIHGSSGFAVHIKIM